MGMTLKTSYKRLKELRQEIMTIHTKYWVHPTTGENGINISPFVLGRREEDGGM